MGASASAACALLPVEVPGDVATRRLGAGLPFFYRQGNFKEDGFHAAGDVSAAPPRIPAWQVEFRPHPAGVGIQVGAAPPVPWPSVSPWPGEVFFAVDGAFVCGLAVELALREQGDLSSSSAYP